jgi:hypothetical protein
LTVAQPAAARPHQALRHDPGRIFQRSPSMATWSRTTFWAYGRPAAPASAAQRATRSPQRENDLTIYSAGAPGAGSPGQSLSGRPGPGSSGLAGRAVARARPAPAPVEGSVMGGWSCMPPSARTDGNPVSLLDLAASVVRGQCGEEDGHDGSGGARGGEDGLRGAGAGAVRDGAYGEARVQGPGQC